MGKHILEIIFHLRVQKLQITLTPIQNEKTTSSQLALKWCTLQNM